MKKVFIIRQGGRILFVCRSLLLVYRYMEQAMGATDKELLLSYSQYARKFETGTAVTVFSKHTAPFEIGKFDINRTLKGAQMPLLTMY